MRQHRAYDKIRTTTIDTSFNIHAEGCALIRMGNTKVLCTASVEEKVPPFKRNTGSGWVTAEYSMLPRSTHTRGNREATRGKQGGRTLEIQRLIGRSLRACMNLELLGERSIYLDCDVLQADGGTRTASINGAWVALRIAVNKLLAQGLLEKDPIHAQVSAISCGIVKGQALLDLEYSEDAAADMDANFVMTSHADIIELQASAEDKAIPWQQIVQLKTLAQEGIAQLVPIQQQSL